MRTPLASFTAFALAIAAHVMLPVPTGAQAAYTYTVIERVPSTSFNPSINAAGQVAFARDGIVRRGDGNSILTIYGRPLGEGPANGDVSINAAGTVVFWTAGGGLFTKIWIGDGVTPATVFAPANATWTVVRNPSINDAGQVVFEAVQASIPHVVTGQAFTVIAAPNQVVPGGTLVRAATPVINNAGQIAFNAQINPLGIRVLRDTGGLVETAGMSLSTGAYTFGMNDAGVVASYQHSPQAILLSDGRKIEVPGLTIEPHRSAINGAGVVAFMAGVGLGSDRVLISDGSFTREVLKVGDVAPGLGAIRQLAINNFSINDAGQIAIWVIYDDAGTDRQAIIRADPALDTTAPEITVPDNIVVEATSPDGAIVEFEATATDTDDPSPVVECEPPSGATFPVGTTIVTCTATDASGNSASASFEVTVTDSTGPALTVPGPLTAEATSAHGAVVVFTAMASDPGHPDPVVTCTPPSGSVFPLGTTIVTCIAVDAHGNHSTASFTVTVRDTTEPELTVPDGLFIDPFAARVVPPYTVTAVDLADPSPVIDCAPPPGTSVSAGVDVVVTCTATDASGNVASASFTIDVLSLPEIIQRMIDTIEALDLERGLKQTLVYHLRSAAANVGGTSRGTACAQLNVFKAQLAAAVHTGRIPASVAQPLMQTASNIFASLGCWQGVLRQ